MNKDIGMKIFNVVMFFTYIGIVIFLGKLVGSVETLEERLQYSAPKIEKISDLPSLTGDSANVAAFVHSPNNDVDLKYTYVPSYSHVYRNNGRPLLLESTLSIRNTDPQYPLKIHKVEYYDSNGKMIRTYAGSSFLLDQLSTVEYLSEKMNEEGGFGAFFVVLWSSENTLADPIIESVMIESETHKQISFVSRGKTMPFKFNRK